MSWRTLLSALYIPFHASSPCHAEANLIQPPAGPPACASGQQNPLVFDPPTRSGYSSCRCSFPRPGCHLFCLCRQNSQRPGSPPHLGAPGSSARAVGSRPQAAGRAPRRERAARSLCRIRYNIYIGRKRCEERYRCWEKRRRIWLTRQVAIGSFTTTARAPVCEYGRRAQLSRTPAEIDLIPGNQPRLRTRHPSSPGT